MTRSPPRRVSSQRTKKLAATIRKKLIGHTSHQKPRRATGERDKSTNFLRGARGGKRSAWLAMSQPFGLAGSTFLPIRPVPRIARVQVRQSGYPTKSRQLQLAHQQPLRFSDGYGKD